MYVTHRLAVSTVAFARPYSRGQITRKIGGKVHAVLVFVRSG